MPNNLELTVSTAIAHIWIPRAVKMSQFMQTSGPGRLILYPVISARLWRRNGNPIRAYRMCDPSNQALPSVASKTSGVVTGDSPHTPRLNTQRELSIQSSNAGYRRVPSFPENVSGI